MQQILDFLKDLQANNTREWFQSNKSRYEAVKERYENYVMLLIAQVREIDPTVDVHKPKDCTFRIYRDTRFSKNKLPYKDHMGAYIATGGRKSPYAGYYLHVSPSGNFMGGGIYRPESKVLKAIRSAVFDDPESFKTIIENQNFKETFGEIYGERLKTAPQGYPKDWPDIDLIRPKSYALVHPLSEAEITGNDFFRITEKVWRTQLPFNNFLNGIVRGI